MNAAVRELTETFVSNLATLIRDSAMETVRKALGVEDVAAGDAPARPTRTARTSRPVSARRSSSALTRASKSPGQKRSPEELEQLTDKLLNYIATNPGERIEQVGKGLGVPTRELVLPVKKLVAARSIRVTGHKRATQYYARG